MAVTQQLARISALRASCARGSAAALESIVSLDIAGNDAFADFDWSPRVLYWSLYAMNEVDLAAVVEQAFGGAELLNADYPDGTPPHRVYSEIAMHQRDTVKKIATELSRLPIASMTKTRASVRAAHPDRELPDDFPAYIRRHASALVKFHAAASESDQVVITWWD
ncbi:hypothetical protein [Lysobacter capsici]|uniref:hypothetical protein n=1 Tax=Lysobacter capsici TaxID=435897 RepID=UPI0006280750|nr:hypothetical protein [Lysobacter capsici]